VTVPQLTPGRVDQDAAVPGSLSSVLRRIVAGRPAPALAATFFLSSAAVLCLVCLLVPGLIRPEGWRLMFVGITCILGLGAVIALKVRQFPIIAILAINLLVDLIIVVGAAAVVDRGASRVAAALFALPSLYLALYTRAWMLVPQSVAVLAGSFWIMQLGGTLDGVAVTLTIAVLVSVLSPTAAILVLRHRLIRALRRARILATTDPLTGLLNRRGLTEHAPRLVQTVVESGGTLGVVVADVDHFKQINDRHGHAVGDRVLQFVAEAARACTSSGDLVVRLGGEELAVLTASSPEAVIDLAERIRHQVGLIADPWAVTVSLGVAWAAAGNLAGDPVLHSWSLVDEADDLMYAAKRAGRNRVSLPTTP
jgi:diguanylate cyclase (GGDEF)-like protein